MANLFKRIFSVFFIVFFMFTFFGCSNGGQQYIDNDTENTSHKKEKESANTAEITVGVIEEDVYNPLLTKSSTLKNMLGFIFEPLFKIDNNKQAVGVLAESYEVSPDGKSIRISLKKDAVWHNGKRFTTDDVIYTIDSIKNNYTEYDRFLVDVRSAEALDIYTLKVTFVRSVSDPVKLFSFPIIQKGTFDVKQKPIGTGPFCYGAKELKAFDDYYGNKPQVRTVKIKKVPDREKFVSLFNASVIDVADSSVIDMKVLTPRNNANVIDYTSNEMVFVGLNSANRVFSKKEARRSIYELVNRKNIASHIYFSRADVSFYPLSPESDFYPNVESEVDGNVGEAERCLQDNGWEKDGNGTYYLTTLAGVSYFSVDILVNSEDEERVKIAMNLSETMSKLGMRNSVSQCSEAEFWARINNRNYDMFIGKTTLLPNADSSDLLAGENIFNYSDEKMQTLLSQLGTVNDNEDKAEVYGEFFEHFRKECPIVPICFLKESVITSAKIKSGVSPLVSGMLVGTENWSVK